jgi:hypothetical protein
MPEVSVVVVLVATVAAFVVSSVWYVVFDVQRAEPGDARAAEATPPWKLAVEFLRSLLVAAVVAGLAARGEIDQWTAGVLLGLSLWAGFPFVLLTGSVIWENVPWRLAATHAGDWLAKLLVIAVVVSVWQ